MNNCPLCIDGFAPAGTDPILDALYRVCPACGPHCADCGGIGVYPAATHCLACFVETLDGLGYIPMFCPGCGGVVHLTGTTIRPERSQS